MSETNSIPAAAPSQNFINRTPPRKHLGSPALSSPTTQDLPSTKASNDLLQVEALTAIMKHQGISVEEIRIHLPIILCLWGFDIDLINEIVSSVIQRMKGDTN